MNLLFKSGINKCRACKNGLTGKKKTCYACANDLVGTEKENSEYGEFWECQCTVWECECVECNFLFCPMCNDYFKESAYLAAAISDIRARWIANMVTHYRHQHITSWNKMWGTYGDHYQQAAHFRNYEVEKNKVNERAKRQIIKKCTAYLIEHEITKEHFFMLENNDDSKTVELLDKKLP
jgi:hypothetical protein